MCALELTSTGHVVTPLVSRFLHRVNPALPHKCGLGTMEEAFPSYISYEGFIAYKWLRRIFPVIMSVLGWWDIAILGTLSTKSLFPFPEVVG